MLLTVVVMLVAGCGSDSAPFPAGADLLRILPGRGGDWTCSSPWYQQVLQKDRPEQGLPPLLADDFDAGDPEDLGDWLAIRDGALLTGPSGLAQSFDPPRRHPVAEGQVLAFTGPGGACRVLAASPLSHYVLTARVKVPPTDQSQGMHGFQLVELRQRLPAGATLEQVAEAFHESSSRVHAITADQAQVAEADGSGFAEWRFELSSTIFGTRSLVLVALSAWNGAADAPGSWFDDVQVHEIPIRAGLAWMPKGTAWCLPDQSTRDLEHRTALVRRDNESRPALLVPEGGEVEARFRVGGAQGRLRFGLCVLEEDRLIRDGPWSGEVQVEFGPPQQLQTHTIPLEWRPGFPSPWRDLMLPLPAAAGDAREVVLRVHVQGEEDPVGALIALSQPVWTTDPGSEARRPNIVLISLDTLRADRLGRERRGRSLTPHLDALAARSHVFRNAHSLASYTLPSHVSMFTGQRPMQHGMLNPRNEFSDTRSTTLTQSLAQAGYLTTAFTAGAMLNPLFCGLHRGFDHYGETDPMLTESDPLSDMAPRWHAGEYNRRLFAAARVEQRVLPWMEAHKDTPFFLFLHTYQVHNYHPGEALAEEYSVKPTTAHDTIPLWERGFNVSDVPKLLNQEDWSFQEDRDLPYLESLYDATVVRADQEVGRILEALRKSGLEEDTIVIVVSDHGEEFLEHGGLAHARTLYQEMLHVPWILHVPGRAPAAVDDLVDLTQLPATVLGLLGLDTDPRMMGQDALASLEPQVVVADSLVERQAPPGDPRKHYSLQHAARRHQYKWIEETVPFPMEEDQAAGSIQLVEEELRRLGYLESLEGGHPGELFDLEKDPNERANLSRPEVPDSLEAVWKYLQDAARGEDGA